MTLHLLIDESADSHELRRLLTVADLPIVLPMDAGLRGADDDVVFVYAQTHGLTVLTKNPADFRQLHQEAPPEERPGIFLIYKDNDPSRDMADTVIVRAIHNLRASGVKMANEVHVLNHWRY